MTAIEVYYSGSFSKPYPKPYPGLNYPRLYQTTVDILTPVSMSMVVAESTSSLKRLYFDPPNNYEEFSFKHDNRLKRDRGRETVAALSTYNKKDQTFKITYTVKSRLLRVKTYIEDNHFFYTPLRNTVDVVADNFVQKIIHTHHVNDLNKSAYLILKEDIKYDGEYFRMAPYTARANDIFRVRFNAPERRILIYEPDYDKFPFRLSKKYDYFRKNKPRYEIKQGEAPQTRSWTYYLPANPCSVSLFEVLIRPKNCEIYMDYIFIEESDYFQNYKNKARFPGGDPFVGTLAFHKINENEKEKVSVQGRANPYSLLPYDHSLYDNLNEFSLNKLDQAVESPDVL